MSKISRTAVFCSLCFVVLAQAQVVHDESVNGDLSDDHLNPTVLSMSMGNNLVKGSTIDEPIDRDFFSLTLPEGSFLTAVILDEWATADDQSFIALQSGPQVTSLNSSDDLLGTALFGAGPGARIGDDILDDLGIAQIGGIGFTPPLGSGTYTFWIQEVSAPMTYGFNFQIVPEPTSAVLCLLAGGILAIWQRRRRTAIL